MQFLSGEFFWARLKSHLCTERALLCSQDGKEPVGFLRTIKPKSQNIRGRCLWDALFLVRGAKSWLEGAPDPLEGACMFAQHILLLKKTPELC